MQLIIFLIIFSFFTTNTICYFYVLWDKYMLFAEYKMLYVCVYEMTTKTSFDKLATWENSKLIPLPFHLQNELSSNIRFIIIQEQVIKVKTIKDDLYTKISWINYLFLLSCMDMAKPYVLSHLQTNMNFHSIFLRIVAVI